MPKTVDPNRAEDSGTPAKRPMATKQRARLGAEWAKDLLAFFSLALVSSWQTWPLLPRIDKALNQSPDSLLNAWAMGWSLHILPRDPLALFQANIFAPRADTLAYSEHMFGITLLAAPFHLLTGNLPLAVNVAILSSFFLCGIGAFLLVKELTGSRWGGVIAGVALLSVPYRFQHLPHVQLLSFQWIVFALWALARFLKRGRSGDAVALAVFVLWQILACNYYAVDTALAFVLVGLVLIIVGRTLLDRRRVLGLLLGSIVSVACALPFFVPYERVREEQGFFRRIEDVTHFSARPVDYLRPSSYNRAPHWEVLPRQYISERVLFPGFVTAMLALAGAALAWPRVGDRQGGAPASAPRSQATLTRVFFASSLTLIVVGALLSFGPTIHLGDSTLWSPYRWLYRYVPGFDSIRVPARHAVLVFVGCALMAGLAARRFQLMSRRPRLLGFALLGALLFDVQTHSTERAFPDAPEIPRVHEWLAGRPGGGAVLVLPIHDADAITEEAWPMYYSTKHFKPLVNGFSGWWPNDYWELVGRLRHFPTSSSLRFLLERAPVEYIVIQYDRYDEVRRRHLMDAMTRYRNRLPLQVRFGGDAVYRVEDASNARP